MWASRANCMTSRTVNQKYAKISFIGRQSAIFARLAKTKEDREEFKVTLEGGGGGGDRERQRF